MNPTLLKFLSDNSKNQDINKAFVTALFSNPTLLSSLSGSDNGFLNTGSSNSISPSFDMSSMMGGSGSQTGGLPSSMQMPSISGGGGGGNSNMLSMLGGGQSSMGGSSGGGGMPNSLPYDTHESRAAEQAYMQQQALLAQQQKQNQDYQSALDKNGTFKGQLDTRNDVEKAVGGIPLLGGLLGFAGDVGRGGAAGASSIVGDAGSLLANNVISPLMGQQSENLNLANPFEQAMNAFSSPDKSKFLGSQLQDISGHQLDPFLKGALDTGSSIAFDPTNLIPGLGLGDKVAGLFKGAKTAEDLAKGTNLADKAMPLAQSFDTTAGGIDKAAQAAENANQFQKYGSDVYNGIKQNGGFLPENAFNGSKDMQAGIYDVLRGNLGLGNLRGKDLVNASKSAGSTVTDIIKSKIGELVDPALHTSTSDLGTGIRQAVSDLALDPNTESKVMDTISRKFGTLADAKSASPSELMDLEKNIRDLSKSAGYTTPVGTAYAQSAKVIKDALEGKLSQAGAMQFSPEEISKIASSLGTKDPQQVSQYLSQVGSYGDAQKLRQALKFGQELGDQGIGKAGMAAEATDVTKIPSAIFNKVGGDWAFKKGSQIAGAFQRGEAGTKAADAVKGAAQIAGKAGGVLQPAMSGAATIAGKGLNVGQKVPTNLWGDLGHAVDQQNPDYNRQMPAGFTPKDSNSSGGSTEVTAGNPFGTAVAGSQDNIIKNIKNTRDYYSELLRQKGYKTADIKQMVDVKYPLPSGDDKKNLQQFQNALSSVDQAQKLYDSLQTGPGVTGLSKSFSSHGVFGIGQDAQANAYAGLKQNLATSLGKSLGNSGSFSDTDQNRVNELMPDWTDTPEAAALKFKQIKEILNTRAQNLIDTF